MTAEGFSDRIGDKNAHIGGLGARKNALNYIEPVFRNEFLILK